MLKRALTVLLLSGVAALNACDSHHSTTTTVDLSALRALNIDKAESDAQKAIATDDFRLLAVQGYSTDVPGAGDDVEKAKDQYGLRMLAGTTDAPTSQEHERLNTNARAY